MSSTSLAMIKYWRKALIDGASQTASLTKKDLGKGYVFSTAPQDGFLTGESLLAWKKHLKEKKQDSSGLFIIPLVYGKKTAHGKTTCAENIDYVMPLYLSCTANIDGDLSVKDNTLPAIPRDILAPLEYLDKVTIATIDEFDEALTGDIDKFLSLSFDDFLKNSLEILTKTSPDFDAILNVAGFSKREGSAVLFEDSRDLFTINIRNLYDCLIRDLKQASALRLPLLDTLCAGKANQKQLPDLKNSFSRRLGYANNKFYLAPNQRLAAACLLNLEEGEILAVNGPPGTGKTSMLLSLIATEFVRAALNEAENPPVIFAASTNNQAVTNILDDFEKIPSEEGIFQRWLPEINSFGSYYPSKSKIEEAAKQGRITEKFFETAQNQDYLKRARESFLDHLAKVSGQNMSLDAALKWLHEALADKQQFLDKALEQYSHYEFLKEELFSDDETVLQAGPFAVVAKLRQFKEQWNTMWQNRSFFEKYFFWLPMFGRKLAMKKANIFEEYYPEYMGRAVDKGIRTANPASKTFEQSGYMAYENDADALRGSYISQIAVALDAVGGSEA